MKLHRTLRGDIVIMGLLRFLPDGHRVVSCGNHSLNLWDTETGLEVGTLYGHRRGVHQIAISHDGNTIYSIGSDREVRTWQAPLARLAASGNK